LPQAEINLKNNLLRALARALVLLFVVALPGIVSAPAVTRGPSEHRLRLYETHTKEHIDIVFREGDHYVPGAITKLDWFLRDHRTGQEHDFDPRLFDLLYDLTVKLGRPDSEIDVICGYRSPWSNEYLREHSSGVAKHSLHMQAMAIDIRMPGVKLSDLRSAALDLHRGGVGYYPTSQFVHVDVGRPRWW
jgi:uncharacterized protein YcbK (DUF882 family)